ncbi:Uncharacterised protein [Mycobacteroides abscessus subsp. abscessus]|nr:hypothetical protein [Mycobacteroides abscessus]MBE5513783.1 hypothetical protein [Mycobacteroides abscessus]SID61589.1 Uncharacterised protein [Mycobacteroides abscessus subsp. abscessus]SIE84084.1 Uncharacterised protein [Mycobacteroides abscessus subsp. abscessus]SIF74911.1 Uncharacterised protein [Mycobacteroides abscessus subsp. abscessus]SIH41122.1 Uncharacterised protein [Mycobacteroides abscessus subsp. abscessus]
MSTPSKVRVVQDHALAIGNSTAMVALFGGVTVSVASLLDDDRDLVDGLPGDAVLAAARREVPPEKVAEIGAWLVAAWDSISDAAAVLDALDDVAADPFLVTPPAALAYRAAAEELAQRDGEVAAACRYVGGQAEARWHRLYGGRIMSSLNELATDPVLEAARRELDLAAKDRLIDWVQETWERIDDLATERAS